ncbi:MAG: AEC family transporter [Anaerolineae bacterium]|jgi:predicted permease|nr:AEC family transporter [Chloroflexota bacterium]
MPLGLSLFTNNVLPSFIIIGVGYLLERRIKVDKRTLSRLAIYVLTPCLVFSSIVNSQVDSAQFGRITAYVIVYTLVMISLGYLVGRALGWSNQAIKALMLSIAFTNSGNMGLSVILFTFGQDGFALGATFFVATNLTANTLAAFIAAHGRGSLGTTLLQVLKLPGIYAFALALIVRSLGQPPLVVMRPISLIAQAQIPVMLMMLGVQLSQTQLASRLRDVSIGVILRLVGGAAVAFMLVPLFGLTGLARQVSIAQSSTPAAVSSALMAIEFGATPDYVASVIFFSTLFSSVTLSVLLALLVG